MFYKSQIKFFSDAESSYFLLKKFNYSRKRFNILRNWLKSNNIKVFINQDNRTEPKEEGLCGDFSCNRRNYPHFMKKMCNVYNKIVKKAVEVAKKSNSEDDKMAQILEQVADLKKLLDKKPTKMRNLSASF